MFPHAVFALLVLAAPVPSADSAGRFDVPPPSVLDQLRREHHPRDWLRITTGSTRLEVRVAEFGPSGLSGLSTRRSEPAAPASIAWTSIARIDRRVSNFRRGQVTGFLVGGLVGLAGGAWLGMLIQNRRTVTTAYGTYEIYDHYAAVGAWTGAALGATAGAMWWGRAGDRIVHERALYVAGAPAVPPPAVPVVTFAPAPSPPPASLAPAPREVERAVRRLRSGQLLRLRTDFGGYQGYATRISADGLGELRAEMSAGAMAELPAIVPWERIHSVQTRGNSAGRGALVVGASLAVTGGMLGFIAVSVLNGDEKAVTAMFEAGAVCGVVGAAIGGLVGAAIPRWHYVYGGP